MSKLKDVKLTEKEELVIEGTVLADEFRDRKTGKRIDQNTGLNVTADEIDSELAGAGQVLTADGNGGASWKEAPRIYHVDDIDDMGADIEVDALHIGDVVIDDGKTAYIVFDKTNSTMSLSTVVETGGTITVKYEVDDVSGSWLSAGATVKEALYAHNIGLEIVGGTAPQMFFTVYSYRRLAFNYDSFKNYLSTINGNSINGVLGIDTSTGIVAVGLRYEDEDIYVATMAGTNIEESAIQSVERFVDIVYEVK